MKDEILLRMENISKSFPGVKALSDAELTLRAGTVHALMGENGAGKSTLMKCLLGIYRRDGGRIILSGEEIEFSSAKEALEGGVAMVHQELSQAQDLSVMDNMYLGRLPRVTKFLPFTSQKKLYEMASAVLRELDIDINPRDKISTLSVSKRQMIEIAKAVSYRSRVIVFDEPTSSLTEDEAEKLFSIIDTLKKRGCGIIYISHKMDEIQRICDEITVMRDGKYITTKKCSEVTMDEIIRLMVGRTLSERYPAPEGKIGAELLKISGLTSQSLGIKDVNLDLRQGEILGLAGLDGAGRTEILKATFGLCSDVSGKITLLGKRVRNKNPRAAIANGFALVSEERRADGIFPILSIQENTVISSLKKFYTGPLLSSKKMKSEALRSMASLKVKAPSEAARIENLSGGNQQKVIIGRWLLTEPTVMMLDEPTRGIDVLAKYEIYKLIRKLAADGRGIIMVSSEMGELLGMCDRIAVISGGRVAGVLAREDATQEKIMSLAAKYV